MKVDKQIKDISERLDHISFSSFTASVSDGNENSGRDRESWYCIYCDKVHHEMDECAQAQFGDGDRWCEACSRVHRDYAKCPVSGYEPEYRYCYRCNSNYNRDEYYRYQHNQHHSLNSV